MVADDNLTRPPVHIWHLNSALLPRKLCPDGRRRECRAGRNGDEHVWSGYHIWTDPAWPDGRLERVGLRGCKTKRRLLTHNRLAQRSNECLSGRSRNRWRFAAMHVVACRRQRACGRHIRLSVRLLRAGRSLRLEQCHCNTSRPEQVRELVWGVFYKRDRGEQACGLHLSERLARLSSGAPQRAFSEGLPCLASFLPEPITG